MAPLEEYYRIPDVDRGIDKDGWADFRIFNDEKEALSYVADNFEKIVYLLENGKFD